MSDLKRNPDFQFGTGSKSAGSSATAIDESQPRQTLEWKRAMDMLDADRDNGCDPYNTIGTRRIRPRAA
jgi:hypothetical protein